MSYSEYEMNSNYEYNRAQTLIFLDIMSKLMQASYEEKLEIVKETWGEIKEFPKVYFYGDYCSVKIFKESEKIKFTFDCSQVNLALLEQGNPEFGKRVKEKFIEIRESQNNSEGNVVYENTEKVKTSEKEHDIVSVSDDYINLYRNINIK